MAMGDVVNLGRVRKAKARAQAVIDAAANRSQHGRAKAEKKLTKAEQEAAARKLDGHKHEESEHVKRQPDGRKRDDE